MTAKRWPVLDTLRPSRGSFSADLEAALDEESLCSSSRVEGVNWDSISLTPGVPGTRGVDDPEGGWRPSSDCSPDTVLGASSKEPLPSVVSRDSASSSDSTTRFPVPLLLLAAYIRGAPMGQYMATQFRLVPHPWVRMPAKWHKNRLICKAAISVSIHHQDEIIKGYEIRRGSDDVTSRREGPWATRTIDGSEGSDWPVGDSVLKGFPPSTDNFPSPSVVNRRQSQVLFLPECFQFKCSGHDLEHYA